MENIAVLITAPNEEQAAALATALVQEGLAACVNIIRGVRSIYRWEGKVEDEQEVLMVAKTRAALLKDLKERVIQLHPYSVPEVIALPITGGSEAYIKWLEDSTS